MLRDAFGDADDEVEFCFDGFHDGGCGEGWRDVDDRGVAVGRFLGFFYCFLVVFLRDFYMVLIVVQVRNFGFLYSKSNIPLL